MPHIPIDRRVHYETGLNLLCNRLDMRDYEPGDVAYVVYTMMLRNMRGIQPGNRAPTFAKRTRVAATFRAALHEFERRQVDPYEDEKIEQNGEVI